MGQKSIPASNLKNCDASGISAPAYQAADLCAFFGLGSIYPSAYTNFAQRDTTPFEGQEVVDNLVVKAGEVYSGPTGGGGADTKAPTPQPMCGCNTGMRRWLAPLIGSLLLLLACAPSSDAVLQLRNGGSSRYSAEINIGTAHPTTEFTYVWVMQYRIDRVGLFSTPQATGFGPGFDIAKRYIVSFDGSGAISNNWAIGDDGNDTYGTDTPQIGRIYYQALRRRSLGGGNFEQIFYYDLPNLTKTARQDTNKNSAWDPGTYIKWGAVPWTDGEGMDGFIEGAWLFNTALTTTQIINQVTSPILADASLSGNVFAHWPLISNGNDLSSNGRHLSLVGGAGEAFYDGTTNLTSSDTTPPAPPSNLRVSWLEWFFTWLFS